MVRIFLSFVSLAFCLLVFSACVPKTQYEDQQAKLDEAQMRLKSFENNTSECDKDMYLQLKEQAQSLELLNQELLDRNTELSKENSRLKASDSQVKSDNQSCDIRLEKQSKENEEKLRRARTTYDDLIKELNQELARLKALQESKRPGAKSKVKAAPAPAH